jgi:hypothetical protein
MKTEKTAFQIDLKDNVATALSELHKNEQVRLVGDHEQESLSVCDDIPMGHKISLRKIKAGEPIVNTV